MGLAIKYLFPTADVRFVRHTPIDEPKALRIRRDPMSGTFEWFLDNPNTPYYSNLSISLLYTRAVGVVSPSYTSLTLAHNRWHAPWNATTYVGPLAGGPTKSSVPSAF